MRPLDKNDLIQIVPSHKWGGCIAIVDEPKNFGCQAFVAAPIEGGVGHYYIRLNWDEFAQIGNKVVFGVERVD